MKNTVVIVSKDMGGIAPAEIQVIPIGKHDTPKGTFVLDQNGAEEIVRAFDGRKNDMVVDYEHQTIADPPVEAPAAGWIKRLVNRGSEGLWAIIEWTDKARAYIEAREYRYVSPVFLKRRADNRVTGLINVALTNQPNIDGMVPLINKVWGHTNNTGPENRGEKNKEDRSMKNVWKLLGLTEDATEDEAIAVINTLKTPHAVVANKAVLAALGLAETASESEVTGTILAMKQAHGTMGELQSQVNSLTARLTERDAADAVAGAAAAGKITPAQIEWATEYAKRDPAGFQVFVAKAPVVIIQGRIAAGDKPAEGAIDDTQRQINKLMGVDDETFTTFGGDK